MDEEHPAFRQDPPFHDAWTGGAAQGDAFALARRDPPAGWERVASDGWIAYLPDGVAVPVQGWIVHVSACLDNAEAVLGSTFDYCMDRKIPFKFFRSLNALLIRNSTYTDRGSSGEFVTVCPADERHLEIVLHELGAILEGQAGPDIVRDLRWGDGPLHVRYGPFDERWCVGPSGEPEPAITDGDGQLVPDRRGAVFEVPGWVPVPAFLSPHLEARNATAVADIPYVIEIALHFSNGGGLYQARDKVTGQAVVLKEASTNPGLGRDAEETVARLRREHDVLTELAGIDAIPAVRGWFTAGDRQFLAEEFVDGPSLQELFMERYPLAMNNPDEAMLATYTAWVLNVQEQLEAAVASVHERGVVLGNLHPGNVFVREDGSLLLIDFEAAFRVEALLMSSLDDAVLRPAAGRRGFATDEHALASFRFLVPAPHRPHPAHGGQGVGAGSRDRQGLPCPQRVPRTRRGRDRRSHRRAGERAGPARARPGGLGVHLRLDCASDPRQRDARTRRPSVPWGRPAVRRVLHRRPQPRPWRRRGPARPRSHPRPPPPEP